MFRQKAGSRTPVPSTEKENPMTEVSNQLKTILENQTRQDERLKQVEQKSEKMFSPAFLESLRGPAQVVGTQKPESSLPPEEDINSMTNAELLKTVGTIFNTGIGRLDEKYSKNTNNILARIELDKVAGAHDDFDSQFPKMQELWKQIPNLDADKCYRLAAFGSDEAIAKAVEAKAKEVAKGKEQGASPSAPSSIDFTIDEKKSPDQNIDKAFDDIFGGRVEENKLL